MKYIRTKDGVYENKPLEKHLGKRKGKGFEIVFKEQDIIAQADTIEELCDRFVVEHRDEFAIFHNLKLAKQTKGIVYGAIWTNKGLIYVAKMNEKGCLELL